MIELLFVMALSIIGVVLAVLGVGMAGGKKPKMVELAETVQEKIDSASGTLKNYDEIIVKKLDNSGAVRNTVAAGVAAQGIYKSVVDSKNLPEMIASLIGTVGKTIHAGYQPVSHLGPLGKYASEIAYSTSPDDYEYDSGKYESVAKTKNRVKKERERVRSLLEKYLLKEGYGDYTVNVVETIKGGEEWMRFKDKDITAPLYVNTAYGLHKQTDRELYTSLIHELKEKKLKEEDRYPGEVGMEELTIKEYRAEMDDALKAGDIEKYLSSQSKLEANIDYVLKQEGKFFNKLMKKPAIEKEVKEYVKYKKIAS